MMHSCKMLRVAHFIKGSWEMKALRIKDIKAKEGKRTVQRKEGEPKTDQ